MRRIFALELQIQTAALTMGVRVIATNAAVLVVFTHLVGGLQGLLTQVCVLI